MPVFADVCIVPEGKCATEATPCEKDYFNTSTDRATFTTDGDTTKISIQHQQELVSAPVSFVAEICYQSENSAEAALYSLKIMPSGMFAPTSCEWDCKTATGCDGWHDIHELTNASILGEVCPSTADTEIKASYTTFVGPLPDGYPTGNVILAQITFTGVNKPVAALEDPCTSAACGVLAANIATLTLTKGDVRDNGGNLVVADPPLPADIQVIPTQCSTYPVTTAQTLTCVPATVGTPLCPASPALTTVSTAWTPRDPPCDLPGATIANGNCGAVTYDLYVGGAQGAGGALVSNDFTGVASSSTVLGIGDTAAETIEYWVYTNTFICGSETTGKKLGDTADCACRTALITSVKVGTSDVDVAEPQAGTDIEFKLTLTDSDSQPSELTIVAYVGCTGNGCTDGANSTYASPAGPITVCSPTTTPCSTSITFDLDGETYANFEDSDTAESLAIGFLVQESGATLSGKPTGYTGGTLVGFTDYEISAANWKFSPYLIFKKDNEPYPDQLPFIATGGNSLCLNFQLIEKASVTLRIYHPDGTLIRVLDNDPTDNVASCAVLGDNKCNWNVGCKWDGTSYLGSGNLVANGLYLLQLYAVGTGTSYSGNIVERRNGIVVMK